MHSLAPRGGVAEDRPLFGASMDQLEKAYETAREAAEGEAVETVMLVWIVKGQPHITGTLEAVDGMYLAQAAKDLYETIFKQQVAAGGNALH